MMDVHLIDGIEWYEAAQILMRTPLDMVQLRAFEQAGTLDRFVTKCGGYLHYRKSQIDKLLAEHSAK